MKILHVITRSEWGGAQKIVYQLALAQRRLGHSVTVMCGEQGRLVQKLQKSGIKICLNRFLRRGMGLDDIRAGFFLWHNLKEGYDVVHAHSSKAGALVRLLVPYKKIPVCFTVHGFGVSAAHQRWKRTLYHMIESRLAQRTNALIFLNLADYEEGKSQGWINNNSNLVKIVPNGVDIKRSQGINEAQRIKIRKSLGIPPQAYVIGNLARVAWIKNPEFWLEVAKKYLQDDDGDSFFVWFGAGEPSKLRQLNTVFPGRILFPGEMKEIESALACIDVLFLSSHSEGMPLAVLECMSYAIPVLAPELPGLVEMFRNSGRKEECAILYKIGDHIHAQSALKNLQNRDLRQELGVRCYAKCKKEYSLTKMVHAYEDIYREICN